MSRWGWSKSKLIKFIKVLEKDSMLVYKSDSKKTSIKLVNFIDYQDFEDIEKLKKDHRKTVESLQKDLKKSAESLQKATNNKENKENKEIKKDIIERKTEFENQTLLINNEFKILSGQGVRKFIDYWTEYSDKARKFRQEKETTWDTKKRLERWKNNNYGHDKSNDEQVKTTVRDYTITPEEAIAQLKAEQEEARRG